MVSKYLTAVVLALVSLSNAAHAKTPVQIFSQAQDDVGKRLVYSIREAVGSSSIFSLFAGEQAGAIGLRFVSIQPDQPGIYTTYAIAITMETSVASIYVANTVGNCGSEKIAECTQQVMAFLDEQRTRVFEHIAKSKVGKF